MYLLMGDDCTGGVVGVVVRYEEELGDLATAACSSGCESY